MLVADRFAYAQLLGLYLGDGHLDDTGRTHQLIISLDAKHPELVDEAWAMVQVTAPDQQPEVVRRSDATGVIRCGWKRWPELLPQHGPGRKHERPIVLEPWQQEIVDGHPWELLRGLLQSDGCRTVNRFTTTLPSGRVAEYAYPRWFFSNESADIRALFCRTCEAVGLRWTQPNRRNISISHRAGVAALDEHVGPKR